MRAVVNDEATKLGMIFDNKSDAITIEASMQKAISEAIVEIGYRKKMKSEDIKNVDISLIVVCGSVFIMQMARAAIGILDPSDS